MQRFKKYAMAKGNCNAWQQPIIFGARYGFGRVREANLVGKFDYDKAKVYYSKPAYLRTMQAQLISSTKFSSLELHLVREHLKHFDAMLKRSGFRLP